MQAAVKYCMGITCTCLAILKLNKNTLGVKKVQGQKEAALPTYVRPKSVISAEAKKLLYKKSNFLNDIYNSL